MKLEFLEFPSNSTMLPPISVPIYVEKYDADKTKVIGDIILNMEQDILAIELPEEIIPGKTTTPRPSNWLTGRLPYYNLFDNNNPEIQEFKQFVTRAFRSYQQQLNNPVPKTYIHGWINMVRKGEQITPHNHAGAHANANETYSYVSGNYCVRADNTTTNYRSPFINSAWIKIPNNNGDLVLFPSFVFHNTSVNEADEPRLSLAFDIITEQVYNNLPDNFKKIFCLLEPQ